MVTSKRTALFGGTFDPVHVGHTVVAAAAAEHIGAEKVIFIPAKRSPLKDNLPRASDVDRFNMISLAIEDDEKFGVSDCELKRQSPSFTLDSVRRFQAELGGKASIFWLIGADGISELSRWYKIEELIDECSLSVMYRAGFEKPDFEKFLPLWGRRRVEKLRENIIPTPLVDVSSTQVRQRLASGLDVAQMLHPKVLIYIRENNLYGLSTK
ncbi:MAG: nicotinate (nicotinamide) nucleotide adenylyltransferase [Sedimentisphaerales bacterium]|nr:nicotinate (nicotinamide) nucleotide adenylyltransferase [Sedimentisphaerales bacterium]